MHVRFALASETGEDKSWNILLFLATRNNNVVGPKQQSERRHLFRAANMNSCQ
jgi:hypothetical protein